MKKLLIGIMVAVFALGSVGCTQLENPEDWERVTPTIKRVSEIALLTALQRPDVAERKNEICGAVYNVADVLDNIENPDATFDQIRQIALDAVNGMVDLDPELKQIVLVVVDQVLDVAFQYVETYYNGLLQEDKVKIVIMVTRAVADGFRSGCDGLPDPASVEAQIFP